MYITYVHIQQCLIRFGFLTSALAFACNSSAVRVVIPLYGRVCFSFVCFR